MRQLNALTVRLVLPSSLTRNTNPVARETKMHSMVIKMIVLVNICYTPQGNEVLTLIHVE